MTDLIERARTEMDLRKRMHGDDRSNWSRADRMMEELLTALEAAREYVAEADRRVGEQFNKAQRSEAYALEKAAETLTLTKELEAAREDAEFFRWLAVHPNLYTVCDLLREGQYLTLRRACESLVAITRRAGRGWRMRDLIGKPVRIEWRRPEHDWPTFTVLAYDPPMLHLQGRDDGDFKHDGDTFWVNAAEIVSIVPEQEEGDRG